MSVSAGSVFVADPKENLRLERQEYRLREKMIKKKHRKLYRSMMQGRTERGKEAWLLNKKRQRIDEEEKKKKKQKRKEQLQAAVNAASSAWTVT